MPKVPVSCKTCGEPTTFGPRCEPCQTERDRRRNANPYRREYHSAEYLNFPLSGKCAICGKPGTPEDPLTRDHVKPVSLGGTVKDGIRIVHRSENSARGNRG